MGLIRLIRPISPIQEALGNFHSLNLKAARSGYRAEIDDRNRTDILIGLIEYPTLKHGGREFRLNRRVVRRHVERNLGGPPVLSNSLRGHNHVSFTETSGDAHELVGWVERRGRRRGKQRGFNLSLIAKSLVVRRRWSGPGHHETGLC